MAGSEPATLNIDIYQGDTFSLPLDFDISVSGYTWLCQIRATADAASVAQTVTVTEVDAAEGLVTLSIAPADTAALAAGSYVWDLQSTDGNSVVRTWLAGKATVTAEVSRP